MAEWVGIVIAAASFLVAVLAFRKSDRAQRQANEAQRRIVEIEEQREQDRLEGMRHAILHGELRKTGRHGYRLCVKNRGEAEGRNLNVTLDGKQLGEHEVAIRNDPLPTYVGANSEVSCLLGIHQGCAPPFELAVIWDDDAGTGHSYRTTLTF